MIQVAGAAEDTNVRFLTVSNFPFGYIYWQWIECKKRHDECGAFSNPRHSFAGPSGPRYEARPGSIR
jgi:hypothetical protein